MRLFYLFFSGLLIQPRRHRDAAESRIKNRESAIFSVPLRLCGSIFHLIPITATGLDARAPRPKIIPFKGRHHVER
jgi:hypothetical protein